MKTEKVEKYEAGYSRTDLLKKGSAAVVTALLMCGGLASCNELGYEGGEEYYPNEYDGGVSCVSQPDVSSVSSDDEEFTLDGDVAYVQSESEN